MTYLRVLEKSGNLWLLNFFLFSLGPGTKNFEKPSIFSLSKEKYPRTINVGKNYSRGSHLTTDHVSPISLIGRRQLTLFPFLWLGAGCKLYGWFTLKLHANTYFACEDITRLQNFTYKFMPFSTTPKIIWELTQYKMKYEKESNYLGRQWRI